MREGEFYMEKGTSDMEVTGCVGQWTASSSCMCMYIPVIIFAVCVPCSRLTLERCSVHVSAGMLAILTEVCNGCPQSLKTNAGIVPLSNHLQFISHSPSPPLHPV
jgi:hypothetical protein